MASKNKLWKTTVSYEVDVLLVAPTEPDRYDGKSITIEE